MAEKPSVATGSDEGSSPATSNTLANREEDAVDARYRPSGEKEIRRTAPVCPAESFRAVLPVPRSSKRIDALMRNADHAYKNSRGAR